MVDAECGAWGSRNGIRANSLYFHLSEQAVITDNGMDKAGHPSDVMMLDYFIRGHFYLIFGLKLMQRMFAVGGLFRCFHNQTQCQSVPPYVSMHASSL
jgi:hypothetical protein